MRWKYSLLLLVILLISVSPAFAYYTCSDTDGETGYDTAGTIFFDRYNLDDFCSSSNEGSVIEYSCAYNSDDGYFPVSEEVDCVAQGYTGCTDGACVNEVVVDVDCDDGTVDGSCSENLPYYCDDGDLVYGCSECGCPSGYECLIDATCSLIIEDTEEEVYCNDGTLSGECNEDAYYCDNGVITEDCTGCGCGEGYECDTSTKDCVEIDDTIEDEVTDEEEVIEEDTTEDNETIDYSNAGEGGDLVAQRPDYDSEDDDSLPTRPEETVEDDEEEEINCDSGCLTNDENCIPVTVRTADQYCDVDLELKNQIESDQSCNNNFECISNVCVDSQCADISRYRQILNWLLSIFGSEDDDLLGEDETTRDPEDYSDVEEDSSASGNSIADSIRRDNSEEVQSRWSAFLETYFGSSDDEEVEEEEEDISDIGSNAYGDSIADSILNNNPDEVESRWSAFFDIILGGSDDDEVEEEVIDEEEVDLTDFESCKDAFMNDPDGLYRNLNARINRTMQVYDLADDSAREFIVSNDLISDSYGFTNKVLAIGVTTDDVDITYDNIFQCFGTTEEREEYYPSYIDSTYYRTYNLPSSEYTFGGLVGELIYLPLIEIASEGICTASDTSIDDYDEEFDASSDPEDLNINLGACGLETDCVFQPALQYATDCEGNNIIKGFQERIENHCEGMGVIVFTSGLIPDESDYNTEGFC